MKTLTLFLTLITISAFSQPVININNQTIKDTCKFVGSSIWMTNTTCEPGSDVTLHSFTEIHILPETSIRGNLHTLIAPPDQMTSGNLIKNGTFDIDTAHWQSGAWVTTCVIQAGQVYVESYIPNTCNQVVFGQTTNISEAYGKSYRLEFDLQSDKPIQVCPFHDTVSGYQLLVIPSDSMKHYSIDFMFTYSDLYAIKFISLSLASAWLRLDNVTLVELTPVFVPAIVKTAKNGLRSYCNLLGQKVTGSEKGIYIKNGRVYNGNH